MDLDLLISTVYKNPIIWDKRKALNKNRQAVDKCWAEVSKEMKEDEFAVRRKWKYLRDQFCVEWGRVFNTDIESKWKHFKLLEFLKVVVKARTNQSTYDELYGQLKPENVETDYDIANDSDETAHLVESICPSRPPTKQKRERLKMERGQRAKKKPRLEPDMENSSYMIEEDEHLHFFKSILPHVRRIPNTRLLTFRSRIQHVVEEFAYGADATGIPEVKYSPRYDTDVSESDPIENSE